MRHAKFGLGALVLVSGMALLSQPGSAANWPRFRGPNGTGIATDKDIPVEWSENSGILWKTAIPGVGNSSPVVWGDRLFLQSASDDGVGRTLWCVNVSDGKVLWSRSLPGSKARIHKLNSWASSTPATDGERVYTVMWDGREITMHAFDFQGKEVWNRNLGSFVSQHGAGASPIVYKDKVIFVNDQDKDQGGPAAVLALEAKTGKPAYAIKREPHRACYAAPLLLEKPGGAELIVTTTTAITGYNPDTGVENWVWHWKFAGMQLRMVGSPVFSQGLLFLASGDGSGLRHFACVKVGDKGDVSKTNLAWESKKRTMPYVPCALVWGQHLFFVNDEGLAECHVAQTGELVWSERLGGDVTASPVLIDGKIYAVTRAGDVCVFPAAPEFKLLAKNSMNEDVLASPAVADNRLFIRGRQHLFCIGKPGQK